MNARRLGTAPLLGVELAFFAVAPASAHAELVAGSPAAGEALAAASVAGAVVTGVLVALWLSRRAQT